MNISIINIGDELLNGQLVNTNAAWMSEQLSRHNFFVQQILTIPDDKSAIKNTLDYVAGISQVIFITGGLGPTNDDITVETLAEFFGCPLVENEEIKDHIIRFLNERGVADIPENNFKQTLVWKDADIIPNAFGTAYGLWKVYNGNIYIVTPGVPFEMKEMLVKHILPQLNNLRNSGDIIINEYILTLGIGESVLAEKIKDIENRFPEYIHLAYLPRFYQVLLRITGKGTGEHQIRNEILDLKNEIISRIPEYVIADEDIPLEKHILNVFNRENMTLASAESCTGGRIASLIVSHSGSSRVFMGSVVSYSDDSKNEILDVDVKDIKGNGAVSEIVAISMAEHAKAKFRSDYAVSTTGIAGPTGATTRKPVGMVWIAVAGKTKTVAKVYYFKNDRLTNIERSAYTALRMLWELYMEENNTTYMDNEI